MKNFEHDFTLPPFPGFPSASRYVPIGPVCETVARVERSVLAREAISLIIGPPGTGKSLACALLAQQFSGSHDVVAIGETSITDENSFYRFLLHRLGLVVEFSNRDEMELMLHDRFAQPDAIGAVLIIDEAATLSANVLEAIRRLTNIMRVGQPMVSAIIAGGVKLDETLTAPSMEPFVQRVTARCYLHPLNAQETRQYIHQSIEACQASPSETITDEAVSSIFHASSGVPRLINQLMTEAIDCAAERDESLIDERTIDRAWASLQQLPGPMLEEPEMERQVSTIEFGELIDADAHDEVAPKFDIQEEPASFDQADEPFESVDHQSRIDFEISDDQADPCEPPVADPVKLFGEFDNEEAIEVGAAKSNDSPKESIDLDLEAMIHSEIVSLSQFASENTISRLLDTDQEFVEREQEHTSNTEAEPEAAGLGSDAEFPSVVWYDEPLDEAAESESQADPKRDDSDLLWITEDVDVERRDAKSESNPRPHRVDQPSGQEAPKLNVDYREMLEKMRNQA